MARADAAAEPDLMALSRMTLAASHGVAGDMELGLALLTEARDHATGLISARVSFQRASILSRQGDSDAARSEYTRAVPVLRDARDHVFLAHALTNRGILDAYSGRPEGATAAFSEAEQLYRREGLERPAAVSVHNRGFAALQEGRIPEALRLFTASESELTALGVPLGPLHLDWAYAFLAAGKPAEAARTARIGSSELEAGGDAVDAAEGHYVAALAAHAADDFENSITAAESAAVSFTDQGRSVWAAAAELVECRSQFARSSAVDASRVKKLAERLDSGGLLTESETAYALAAHLEPGRANESALLAIAQRSAAESSIDAWRALAVAREFNGNTRGARRAVAAGLRATRRQLTAFGNTSARAAIASRFEPLVAHGLRFAHSTPHARASFAQIEQLRVARGFADSVSPPSDSALAESIDEYRALGARKRTASDDTLKRVAAEERQLRSRIENDWLRHAGSVDTAESNLEALIEHSDDVTLIQLSVSGDSVQVVELAARRFRRTRLALREIASLGRGVSAELRRLAADPSRSVRRLKSLSRSLSDGLIPHGVRGAGPIAVSGPSELSTLPLGLVREFGERATTLSPTFVGYVGRPAAGPRIDPLAIAGPDLHYADREARAVAAVHAGAELGSVDATVDRAVQSLRSSDLAHLACHGIIDNENPLFSRLVLADGDLTGHELERAGVSPDLVVLSACSSGVSSHGRFTDYLGFARSFLAMGTRNVIAPVVPTMDHPDTVDVMVELHKHIAEGASPAEAAMRVRQVEAESPAEFIARNAMVVFGAP